MPPRRSTTRNATATPAPTSPSRRSTRASSALPGYSASSTRVTRSTPHQSRFEEDVVNNPNLPELQTQQSYAYGSTKTNLLPEQLIARQKMSLKQMAETIDDGVRQAERHLNGRVTDAKAYLQPSPETDDPHQRTTRRSREHSKGLENPTSRRHNRVAAWASSLESDQLQDISEHESRSSEQSTDDNDSRRDTEPSSFPSGIFDHSYNYERGLRRPRFKPSQSVPSFFQRGMDKSRQALSRFYSNFVRFLDSIRQWTVRFLQKGLSTIKEIPDSPFIPVLTKMLFAMGIISLVGFLFCSSYTNYLCDSDSTTPFALFLQKHCGRCLVETDPMLNFTLGNSKDMSKLSAALTNINQQIRRIETRLSDKLDSQYTSVRTEMDSLRREQTDITNQIAHIGSRHSLSADNVPSPLMPRVNYFAPSNGALVNPRLTSPTRQKPFPLPQRIILRMLGLTKYQSKPPITALEAWHDTGDCWCSSDTLASEEFLRLGIAAKEMIYPTELVVEHFPSAGSPSPDTAPKQIELWADFEHLDNEEWQKLSIRDMQGFGPLGPYYAKIGGIKYDASTTSSHVQAFRIDVNQNELLYSAQHFVVRVTSNYGSEYTCLYRVRMHGIPMSAHPEAKKD